MVHGQFLSIKLLEFLKLESSSASDVPVTDSGPAELARPALSRLLVTLSPSCAAASGSSKAAFLLRSRATCGAWAGWEDDRHDT